MDVCLLTSGSCGNSTYISSNGTSILIDAGLSKRYLVNALNGFGASIDDIGAILLTHEHSDHVRGVQSISGINDIPVYSTHGTWDNLYFDENKKIPKNERLFHSGNVIEYRGLTIETFSVSHDASEPVGYRITDEDGCSVAIATDTGVVTKEIEDGIKGANVIILESNYDNEMLIRGKYPYYLKKRVSGIAGHLSNMDCGECLKKVITDETDYVYLAHLSKENNEPDLAHSTVSNMLNEVGIRANKDVSVKLSYRYAVCEPVIIGKTTQRGLFI